MHTLPLPWGRMAYTDNNRPGTPLVLLHGTGCDTADWEPMLAGLPESQRVVACDFRGHGQSDTPAGFLTMQDLTDDVDALLVHLGLNESILVGHSLGGMVAMDLAARSPRVTGLVLFEGWTSGGAYGVFAEDRFYGRLAPDAVAEIKAKSQATAARFERDVWDRFSQSVRNSDASAFLETTPMPVLEVYGDLGRTETTRERLLIPERENITVHWVHGAGHYLPHERPRECAELCACR